MSSTGADPGDAADQAYFLALERAFLALRGRATLLAAEDWQTAREWRRLGVPADLVIAVMESLFERQRERRSKRGISSLRYFRAAVAAAWDERLQHQAGGGAPPPDPGPPAAARLARLAAAIPGEVAGAAETRRAIAALEGPLDEIERALGELETELLDRLESELSDGDRRALTASVESAAARAGGQLPPDAVAALRANLRRQALRRRFELPALSLFSPIAVGGEPEPDAS